MNKIFEKEFKEKNFLDILPKNIEFDIEMLFSNSNLTSKQRALFIDVFKNIHNIKK